MHGCAPLNAPFMTVAIRGFVTAIQFPFSGLGGLSPAANFFENSDFSSGNSALVGEPVEDAGGVPVAASSAKNEIFSASMSQTVDRR